MDKTKVPPILGDPYLAQMIRNVRQADIALKADEWVEGKSIDEIRARIELMFKQYKRTGERDALTLANDLTDLLNAKLRAQKGVKL